VSEERANADSLDCLVGRFEDGCMELEREITCGSHVGWQEGKWHVFRECGCSVNAGAGSLRDLILSLAPNVCICGGTPSAESDCCATTGGDHEL